MKKALAGFSIVLALAAAGPAFARNHSATSYAHVHSGYGPITWDEIEVSHPEGGG
jgi:hypothetical protein